MPLRKLTVPFDARPGLERPTIALVTDDDDLREACIRALAGGDYVVRAARHSGHAMLACLDGQRIDVLIAELSMPDGSGPALLRRMRRYNPALRSIYLARTGTTFDSENVLVRPFTRDDLLKRLEAVLARTA